MVVRIESQMEIANIAYKTRTVCSILRGLQHATLTWIVTQLICGTGNRSWLWDALPFQGLLLGNSRALLVTGARGAPGSKDKRGHAET